MARRPVVYAVALLTVALASAYEVPEALVVRIKRSPEPMRTFSFSGFNPDGQMAAFTGAAEYHPAAVGDYGPYYGSPAHDAYGPSSSPVQDSYGPPASGAVNPHDKHRYAASDLHHQVPADSKEQYNNSVEQTGDKKRHRGRDGPSSNAEASFNAWFPIMFGVFPNGAGGQSGNAAGRGTQNQGQGQDQGNSYGGSNGFERSSAGTTVIANSVSNGRNGVATSHAIAYGNPRSSQK